MSVLFTVAVGYNSIHFSRVKQCDTLTNVSRDSSDDNTICSTRSYDWSSGYYIPQIYQGHIPQGQLPQGQLPQGPWVLFINGAFICFYALNIYKLSYELYTVLCTPYYVHRTMYTVLCTPYYVHRTMYTVLCMLYYVQFNPPSFTHTHTHTHATDHTHTRIHTHTHTNTHTHTHTHIHTYTHSYFTSVCYRIELLFYLILMIMTSVVTCN